MCREGLREDGLEKGVGLSVFLILRVELGRKIDELDAIVSSFL